VTAASLAARPMESSAYSRSLWSKAAWLCVPMILAPPMAMIGPYGITLAEVVVLTAGVMILLTNRDDAARIPVFMAVYFGLYILGLLGSLYNSFAFSIPIGVGNAASFGYALTMSLCGYMCGRYSSLPVERIMTSRWMTWVVAFLLLLAIVYPFISPGMRWLVMRPFINEEFVPRLNSPRFPGMGINANTYSFMVFCVFLFTYAAFIAKRASALLPLGTGIVILAAASRTIVGLVIGSMLVITALAMRVRARDALDRLRRAAPRVRRRALIGTVVVAAVAVPIIVVYGSRIQGVFTLYSRVQDLLSGREDSGLTNRQGLWQLGWQRVHLAPVLGIPKDATRPEDESNPLYYYTPHNEFLYFWSTFGILGALAHVFLVLYLVVRNVRGRTGIVWFLLYGGLVAQMTFDAVFQGPRVVAFVFMIVGLNIRFLADRERHRGVPLVRQASA
jgi:hypothetical protein